MMTQQLGISILTAPLAAIDRRALSQAWYSALHVAREHPASVTAPRKATTVAESGTRETHRASPPRASERLAHAAHAPMRAARGASGAPAADRRATRSPLARRIERTFLDPARRTARATFTLAGTQARVHVALQAVPSGLRLIAICPPSVSERVARALDQARYALAMRGVALLVDVNEVPS